MGGLCEQLCVTPVALPVATGQLPNPPPGAWAPSWKVTHMDQMDLMALSCVPEEAGPGVPGGLGLGGFHSAVWKTALASGFLAW